MLSLPQVTGRDRHDDSRDHGAKREGEERARGIRGVPYSRRRGHDRYQRGRCNHHKRPAQPWPARQPLGALCWSSAKTGDHGPPEHAGDGACVKTRTPRAHGKLCIPELKGSIRALVTDDRSCRIHGSRQLRRRGNGRGHKCARPQHDDEPEGTNGKRAAHATSVSRESAALAPWPEALNRRELRVLWQFGDG